MAETFPLAQLQSRALGKMKPTFSSSNGANSLTDPAEFQQQFLSPMLALETDPKVDGPLGLKGAKHENPGELGNQEIGQAGPALEAQMMLPLATQWPMPEKTPADIKGQSPESGLLVEDQSGKQASHPNKSLNAATLAQAPGKVLPFPLNRGKDPAGILGPTDSMGKMPPTEQSLPFSKSLAGEKNPTLANLAQGSIIGAPATNSLEKGTTVTSDKSQLLKSASLGPVVTPDNRTPTTHEIHSAHLSSAPRSHGKSNHGPDLHMGTMKTGLEQYQRSPGRPQDSIILPLKSQQLPDKTGLANARERGIAQEQLGVTTRQLEEVPNLQNPIPAFSKNPVTTPMSAQLSAYQYQGLQKQDGSIPIIKKGRDGATTALVKESSAKSTSLDNLLYLHGERGALGGITKSKSSGEEMGAGPLEVSLEGRQVNWNPSTTSTQDLGSKKIADPMNNPFLPVDHSTDVIDQVKNYIIQNAHTNGRSFDVSFNHETLGRIDLTVQKGRNREIDIHVTTFEEGGRQFFLDNKSELLNHLTNSGIQVADFKIDSSSASNSGLSQDSSNREEQLNSQGKVTQRQGERGEDEKQQSQKRKELWDILRNQA